MNHEAAAEGSAAHARPVDHPQRSEDEQPAHQQQRDPEDL